MCVCLSLHIYIKLWHLFSFLQTSHKQKSERKLLLGVLHREACTPFILGNVYRVVFLPYFI
jgi:hypothetical protein